MDFPTIPTATLQKGNALEGWATTEKRSASGVSSYGLMEGLRPARSRRARHLPTAKATVLITATTKLNPAESPDNP